ncbi:Gfo/Idh/MocA family protein [Pseudogracilibacillus sp. SO10305]|uniref:Gfo/Idh/MocA family protein n=1 Tax=Pseudogracilibacillus sp. SO10305 TaxID=3098292 RepID=UPI00300E4DE6
MKIKVGIIGMGSQGSFYADVIQSGKVKNMELTTLCSRSEEKRTYFSKKFKNIEFYKDYNEMFDSGNVDAVIICTPHYSHPKIAKAALKKSVHILVDKPAGVAAKDVRLLNDISDQYSNLAYGLIYNQRTNRLYRELKKVIDEKRIGNIRNIHWLNTVHWRPDVYYKQNTWRATWYGEGGGVLINQAAHQIDLLQWLFGVPKKLFAKLKFGYQRKIAVEDDATLIFEYGNGATGIFVTRTHDLLGTDRLEILGDKGKILVENNKSIIIKSLHKPEKEMNFETKIADIPKIVQSNNVASIYEEEELYFKDIWGEQHVEVFENFANNILYREPLIAPGLEGINSVQILNAAYLSGWTENEVTLPVEEDYFEKVLQERIEMERRN